ncbi:TPR-like protein [Byssothecium circinans]|uniref:TPR-like protein n=1 Tax=Byssothecium circinans TaxID=147558 RepID=A0A6A5TYH5_9PLEO|nr:TPR-like protein [Byssothecium circinans]
MGVPHSRAEDNYVWQLAQFLLSPRGKSKKVKGVATSGLKRLASLSTQFEQTANSVPILSIHETEPTTMKKFLSSKTMLIGYDAVTLGAIEEEVLPINTTHHNLCNIDVRGTAFPVIEGFVKRSIAKVRRNIERHADQYSTPPVLNEPTVIASLGTAVASVSLSGSGTSTDNKGTLGTSQSPPEHITATRRDPFLPCFSVPVAQNTEFFGSTDLVDLLADVLCQETPEASSLISSPFGLPSEPRGLRTFAICGAGGVGKSQTAAQFVHEYRDHFDAVFWLHGEEDVILEGEFGHIAVQLNLVPEASQEANNLVIARGRVKGWLAKPLKSYNTHGRATVEEATWLLVFDNVENAESLVDYWPDAGSCGSILLTSRDPLAQSDWYHVSQGVTLKEFGVTEATLFLLKNTWRENDENSKALAPSVVKLLGCHPLALVQMASVIVREQLSYDDFVKRYQEEAEHAELFEQSFVSKQRQQTSSHTIASVWSLHTLKFGAGLLHAMSLFDPDGIQDELLEAAVGLDGTHDYPLTTTKYQKARGELLNASLISKDASEQKLLVHRLTQDAVWARLADPRNDHTEAVASFNSAVVILLKSWPRAGYAERHKKDRWHKCEAYSSHTLRLRTRFVRASSSLQRSLKNNVQLSDLLNELGWYFQERARNEEASQCFKMSQEGLLSILATDSISSTRSLDPGLKVKAQFLLAETHRNLGCSAAEHVKPQDAKYHFSEYNKLMVEEFKPKSPGDDSRLAISYFELATSHIMLEEWNEAEKCTAAALEEAGKLTDPIKAIYTCSLPQINLAFVYLLTNRVGGAEQLLLKTLKQRQEIYGANDRVSMITGRAYHGLGLVKEAQGLLDESYEFQCRALEHMIETAGLYHHRTADMYFKVAQHLIRLGKNDEALSNLNSATKTYNDQACYCAERGRVLYWKGRLESLQHGADQAESSFKDALKLYREARPQDRRSLDELREEDFDRIVTFWSR